MTDVVRRSGCRGLAFTWTAALFFAALPAYGQADPAATPEPSASASASASASVPASAPAPVPASAPVSEPATAKAAAPPKQPGPIRLDYQEGQPIPPGYALRSEFRTELLIAGGLGAWGGYIAASAIAWIGVRTQCELKGKFFNCPEGLGYYPLNIPLAGPVIGIYTLETTGAETAGLIALSALQGVGLTLVVAGFTLPRKRLARTAGQNPLQFQW
jgi:hypothetical protein